MAVRVISKNTSVECNLVRPDQLEFGEIAINYHHSGPFLQVKDTEGNIIRVGGVIFADEQPKCAQKGAWWYSHRHEMLYLHDGDMWLPVCSGAGEVDWNEIINKPDCFEPCEHTHPWDQVTDKPDCFEPCEHAHKWDEIEEKPDCFEPCDHTHEWADITDPPDINDGKLTIKDDEGKVLGEFTANQEGPTEIVIPAGGGDGLDCDGVADCLVNAPIDKPKYAFAIIANKNEFHDSDPPPHFPENVGGSIHLYCELCDPDDHHMLELGEEGHGYCGGNKSIFRAPGRFVGEWLRLAICASPPVYVDDRDAIYGDHPDIIFVKDLKVWKGEYIEGVTTTEELWTTGDSEVIFITSDGHLTLDGDNCDSWDGWECGSDLASWGWNFFRVEFTCHRGDKYEYVFIFSKNTSPPPPGGSTGLLDSEAPDIKIQPMEDN